MSNEVDLSALGGKSAIVIGGASGLGLAIVKRFAHAGAHVTIADVDTEGGSRIVAELESKGLSATLVRCDVTDHASSVEAFEHAIRTSPSKSVDVAALVAGVIGEPGSLVDMVIKGQRKEHVTPPQLRHPALDVNLLGIYNSAYLALWYMNLDRTATGSNVGPGVSHGSQFSKSLILISSTVAYTDVGNFADYHTSKCEY
ncbi:5'-hydroxyaverantin dehydrogenase [Cladophialophora carrionii]|uniref:5'-hydroxyaverantin dehydrogenase n=1 Tax=Cladophialophora carrionii TaxID=86049 RepID=A0A1C1CQ15_9EURO|nr:5'-hydroxyaverantin dehydrogenase [Cladophialophora carrionii]